MNKITRGFHLAGLHCLARFGRLSLLPTRHLRLDEMVEATAEVGFYGEVVGVAVEERDGDPWTVVTFDIEQSLGRHRSPNEDTEEDVSFAFYGGTLPSGESLLVSLMPQFSEGDRVLMLAYDAELYSPVVGFRQGLWRETTLGLRDETGRLLSLDDEDVLTLDGEGGGTEALLKRLTRKAGRDGEGA